MPRPIQGSACWNLKPIGNFVYHQVKHSKFRIMPTRCVCVLFWISEQTALTGWFLKQILCLL